MMNNEMKKELKEITRVFYCDYGNEKLEQVLKMIKAFCQTEELKEIVKIMESERKKVDKRFEEYYKQAEEMGLISRRL